MPSFKTLLSAAAVAGAMAMAPVVASATTVTVQDNGLALSLPPVSGTSANPYVVNTGDTYDVNITATKADVGNSVSNALYFLNNSSANTLLSFASLIPNDPTPFSSASLSYSVNGGAFTSIVLGALTPTFIDVLSGQSVQILATVTANYAGAKLDYTLSPVPVPAAGLLLLGGIGAFGTLRRRKKATA